MSSTFLVFPSDSNFHDFRAAVLRHYPGAIVQRQEVYVDGKTVCQVTHLCGLGAEMVGMSRRWGGRPAYKKLDRR